MSTNGSFVTNAYNGERYLKFTWEQVSQSIANNSTTIKWSLDAGGGSTTKWYTAGNFTVIIDGSTVYRNADTITLYGNTHIANGTMTLGHHSAGNRSFSASVSAGIYAYTSTNTTGKGSWSLNTIPRQATILSAPNFNDENNPTITYSNPAGNAVSKLEACITSSDGKNFLVGYRSISKTGSSYTFPLTEVERNNLRNYCKNSNSTYVKFYIASEIGGTRYYSTLQKTLSIVNALPTMNPTVVDTNTKTIELTGNKDNLIRYKSNASVSCNASARKGASIVSYKITNGNSSIKSASGTINGVQSGKFVFTVKDSRGNTVSKTIDKTCYAYVHPSVSITSTKLSTGGDLTFSMSGNLYAGSFGKTNNARNCYYRIKEQNGQYNEYVNIKEQLKLGSNNTYTATYAITGLDYSKTYIIDCAIDDSFEFISTFNNPTVVVSKPVFDWGKNDFNINVPTITGQLYSLGGIPESKRIKSGDLNGYVTPGVYCVYDTSDAINIKNIPIQKAGRLIVSSAIGKEDLGGTWSYIYQEYIPVNTTLPTFRRSGEITDTLTPYKFKMWETDLSTINTKDFVIAQGGSGMWTYRKWISGISECWTYKEQKAVGTTPTPVMGGYLTTAMIQLPFDIASNNFCGIINIRTGSGIGFGQTKLMSPNQVKIYCVSNQNTTEIWYQLYVIGRRI